MGATRARGIARKAAAARKHITKTTPNSTHRVNKAWEFARTITATARNSHVIKRLEVMANLWGKTPFRVIAGSLTKLRLPPRTSKPAVVAPKREDTVKAPRHPLPEGRPPVPTIILTAPNGEVTIPDVDIAWMKPQVSADTQMQYHKWKSGNFLSPVYPVDAAKEWRLEKKVARFRVAKAKKLQAWKEKKKRAVLRRDLRRWGRRRFSIVA